MEEDDNEEMPLPQTQWEIEAEGWQREAICQTEDDGLEVRETNIALNLLYYVKLKLTD